jgi:hypothetical protein
MLQAVTEYRINIEPYSDSKNSRIDIQIRKISVRVNKVNMRQRTCETPVALAGYRKQGS